ncbi:MAG: helix-turn-helix domain-containing protein, partial [Lachnospiraceae bacterium]|nr:helix-turn-helix domain-containing protein [Lachnospiraceae bacterium]
MTFGEKIKALRKGKYISQDEMAALCQVSRKTIQNWEAGNTRPKNKETYKTLSKEFGRDVSWFKDDDIGFWGYNEIYHQTGKKAEQVLDRIEQLFKSGSMTADEQLLFIDRFLQIYV